MSIYNASIKTLEIDPVFYLANNRAEFRLPTDSLYLTSLRLLNIGVTTTADTSVARYNFLTGSCSTIKNIYLYDGAVVLDQVLDFQNIESFKLYNKENEDNCDMGKVLLSNGLGFVYSLTAGSANAKVTEFYPLAPNQPTISDATTPKSYLNLRQVFPILQQLSFIHTGFFKNLRIVVEYGMNIALASGATGTAKATTIPLLCADQVLNESVAQKWLSEFKEVSWNAMEVEKVLLNAGENGKKQEQYFKLNGFEQKTLGRLLMKKTGMSATSAKYGTNGSEAVVDERVQVRINGSNLLPEGGCDRPNYRLGLLADSFGNCNAIPCSNDTGCFAVSSVVDDAPNRVGRLDYFGIVINKKVSDMQIEYSRLCRAGGSIQYDQPLLLHFIGEVAKALVKSPDGYKILYL